MITTKYSDENTTKYSDEKSYIFVNFFFFFFFFFFGDKCQV